MTMQRLTTIFVSFLKIGMFTFVGGYAMLPLIERELITKRKWIEQKEFLDLLTLAQSVPGPIAVNTSVFVGYKVRGLRGAAAALLGTVTPSFVIILAIAIFFAGIRQNPVVDAAFKGMRPAVVALIIGPVLTLSRGMHWTMLVVIAASALAIWWLDWSPIWILAAAAALGIEAFKAWLKTMKLPLTLQELGAVDCPIEALARHCCRKGAVGHFKPLEKADVEALLRAAQ